MLDSRGIAKVDAAGAFKQQEYILLIRTAKISRTVGEVAGQTGRRCSGERGGRAERLAGSAGRGSHATGRRQAKVGFAAKTESRDVSRPVPFETNLLAAGRL